MPRVYRDIKEFYSKVGLLVDLKYSHGLDIEPCWGVVGLFKPHRLDELNQFVEKNSNLHIISMLENRIFLNKSIQNCYGYFLGEGDKDPEIIYAGISDKVRAFDIETHWDDDSYWLDPFKLRKHKITT